MWRFAGGANNALNIAAIALAILEFVFLIIAWAIIWNHPSVSHSHTHTHTICPLRAFLSLSLSLSLVSVHLQLLINRHCGMQPMYPKQINVTYMQLKYRTLNYCWLQIYKTHDTHRICPLLLLLLLLTCFLQDQKNGGPYCIFEASLSWNQYNIKTVPLFPEEYAIGTFFLSFFFLSFFLVSHTLRGKPLQYVIALYCKANYSFSNTLISYL